MVFIYKSQEIKIKIEPIETLLNLKSGNEDIVKNLNISKDHQQSN